jgi:hypothetical protein
MNKFIFVALFAVIFMMMTEVSKYFATKLYLSSSSFYEIIIFSHSSAMPRKKLKIRKRKHQQKMLRLQMKSRVKNRTLPRRKTKNNPKKLVKNHQEKAKNKLS